MKSDLFKNITEDKMDESYDPRFIKYLASVAIYYCKDEKCSLDYLTKSLEKHYGNTIKTSAKLRNFLNDSFSKNGTNNFIISEDEKTIINFINLLRKRINDLAMYSDEQLYSELCRYIQDENSKFIDIYSYFSALEITSNLNMNLEIILFKIYTLLEERFIEKDKYNERYEIISNINPAYDELNIKNIIKDEPCLNILSISNVNQIKQIKSVKRNLIDLVFIFDNNFFEICKLLTKTIKNSLEDLENDYYERINEKEDDILKLRFGFEDGKCLTLEEVGTIYSCTRERIRQIEAKAIRKVRFVSDKNKILLDILFDRLCKKKKLIYFEDINNFVCDKNVSFIISLMYRINYPGKCRYDWDYKCIYNSEYKIDEIVEESLSKMPIYYSKIQVDELKGINKVIFDNNYKEYHNIFIRKNMMPRNVFINVIKKHFPNGFKNTDVDDYNKLREIILNEVGEIEDFPSIRSLSAMIDRDKTMIMCDRSTMIDIANVNDLSEDLYQRIIDYIYDSKPVVYYNSIFERFKYELKEYDVNNQYLLKGLIDRRLPEDFYSRRDYISVGDKTICPYDQILELIHSYDGAFSINDLRSKFHGMADYVFFNTLYPEKDNGLIFLENKRFIYFNKLNITDDDKFKTKNIIDEMFVSLNSDTISARKVYARIKLFEDRYNLHLKMINSYFDLFSIIQLLFPNDYYYSRPFISTNPNLSTSREELLRTHLIKFDTFSNKDVKEYLTRMNVGGIYSYLMFMEKMSDNYVQIDIDTMVRKEQFNLSEDNLRSIKKTLNLLLSNFECIDTRTFNGYSMFPSLKYDWNKYLLVGIIRTYLSDIFSIDNTENTYHTTDFIIRRDSNE